MRDYGDVVVARQTLLGEARTQGKRPADHLTHLVVHGVLHLLGYDHVAKAEADRMERLEVAILARLGVADPYQTPRRRPTRGLRRR
jgi:probable rRNA maturation factor